MEHFLLYIIRSSLIVMVVILLYQLLKNDLNFTRNRIFLVAGMLVSFSLPMFSFIAPETLTYNESIMLDPVIIKADGISTAVNKYPDIFSVLMMIYAAGIVALLIRNGWQLFYLYRLTRRSAITQTQKYKLVNTRSEHTAFSFFNLIFINKQIDETDAETIIAHEQVHADQRHSIDVMLMEVLVILQWFNPAVWFYRKLLREVHEYLADRSILETGIKKAAYLQLLCSMALRVQPADITNNFCQIKLKRRLTMITKSKNSRYSGVKFIAIMPLLAVLIWLVSCNGTTKEIDTNGVDSKIDQQETTQPNNASGLDAQDKLNLMVDQMPEYVGGNAAMNKFILENIKYPQKAKETGLQGTVYISFVIEKDGTLADAKVEKGIGGGCDEEALRVVKMMPKWIPGKDKGKNVSVGLTLPIKFKLDDKK